MNINAAAGGKGATPAPGGEQEFTEDVGGVEEYQSRLKELWNKRTQLMKAKKKKFFSFLQTTLTMTKI